MISIQRGITLALLLLLAASTVFWLLWTPDRPDAVWRAIPGQAMAVSGHERLAARWSVLADSPLLKAWLHPDPRAATPGALSPADIQIWMQRLKPERVVVALLPPHQNGGEAVPVFAAWIGARGLALRWALLLRRVPDFTRVTHQSQRPIWRLSTPLDPHNTYLYLTVSEGLVLGCLSRSPFAIQPMLLAYDGLIPSTATQPPPVPYPDPTAPDKGWLRWTPHPTAEVASAWATFSCPRVATNGLAADFRFSEARSPLRALSATADLTTPERLLADHPAILMAFPAGPSDAAEPSSNAPPWSVLLRTFLDACTAPAASNICLLAVLTDEFAGAVGREPFRLRVPALIGATRSDRPDAIPSAVNQTLDALNARYRWGLIADPIPLQAAPHAVVTVEATQHELWAGLAAEDRPAYTTDRDWLLLTSNARSLMRLLDRAATAPGPAAPSAWRRFLAETQAGALVRIDLHAGGKALQAAIGAALIGLRHDPRTASSPAIARLSAARAWLESSAPLQETVLWAESGTNHPTLHLRIGAP